jgi:nucleotide-binding universal stress UspA family protein
VKILVPVDGSPSSDRALRFALSFVARMPTTEIRLLNVQEPFGLRDLKALPDRESMERLLHERGVHATKSAREMVTDARVYTECPIEFGDVAETIARYATEHRCDMVVMGSRGLGPVKSLVLGSVAMKVIHASEVPVTVVR